MSGRFDERDGDSPRIERAVTSARRAASIPAVLLIVLGGAGIMMAIVSLIQLNSLPGQIDAMIDQIEADPNMPREQKDQWIDALSTWKDMLALPSAPLTYVANMVLSGIMVVGGIQLFRLSGPGLPTMAAVVAMLPCSLGCCCLFSFPVGLWALVVLFRPEVRIAMARTL